MIGRRARAQQTPAPHGAWRTPGGAPAARVIGWLGALVTLSAIAASLVPSPEAAAPLAATLKLLWASLVLIAAGAGLYGLSRLRSSLTAPSRPA